MDSYQDFYKHLSEWFLKYGRDLPWRKTQNPYHIWISELMLQQTQVVTVLPYYAAWMEKFDSVKTLADAGIDDVLKAWAGLGYYRRARYIHAGAQYLMTHYDGNFPQSVEQLRKIPGIGEYTAGAIAAFAFDMNVPAIDGNAERVLSRYFGIEGDLSRGAPRRTLKDIAQAVADCGKARVINQAIMDLGAGICSKKAACNICPLQNQCFAARCGRADTLPYRKKSPEKYEQLRAAAFIFSNDGHILIARRRNDQLLGGLWEFPMIPIAQEKGQNARLILDNKRRLPRAGLWNAWLKQHNLPSSPILPVPLQITHIFTHIRMQLLADCIRIPICHGARTPEPDADYDAFVWIPPEQIMALAQSTLMKKLLPHLPVA